MRLVVSVTLMAGLIAACVSKAGAQELVLEITTNLNVQKAVTVASVVTRDTDAASKAFPYPGRIAAPWHIACMQGTSLPKILDSGFGRFKEVGENTYHTHLVLSPAPSRDRAPAMLIAIPWE